MLLFTQGVTYNRSVVLADDRYQMKFGNSVALHGIRSKSIYLALYNEHIFVYWDWHKDEKQCNTQFHCSPLRFQRPVLTRTYVYTMSAYNVNNYVIRNSSLNYFVTSFSEIEGKMTKGSECNIFFIHFSFSSLLLCCYYGVR